MDGRNTVGNLLELSTDIEKGMVSFYCQMRQMFSHLPEAEELWIKLRDDEINHIIQLDRIKEALSSDQLAAPADKSIIEKAGKVLKTLNSDRWEEVENLDEAIDLANEYENSEANQIFIFLAERYIPRAERKKFVETMINDHLSRLISLPDTIDSNASRRESRN